MKLRNRQISLVQVISHLYCSNVMSASLESKEQVVMDFIQTISDIDSKPCDEIENNLQRIVAKSRGLIHEDLLWPKGKYSITQSSSSSQGTIDAKINLDDAEFGEKNHQSWKEISGLSWIFMEEDISG